MKKEQIIALLTALCLLLCTGAGFALPAAAEEGAKTEISTAAELAALARGDLSGNYILMTDIDLTGVEYTPIGDADAPFTGTFDGNGYTISGLQLESDNAFQGLFGVNNGTIRNVTLGEDCAIYGSAHVGAIAGRNNGTIENCISRAAVGHYGAVESDGKTYSVMSQNLCQWGDNALTAYDDYVDSTTHSRRPAMLQRIRNADPDIILFQEVSFKDYYYNNKTITAWDTYLRAQLTDYTIVGQYRSDTDFEGITIAFKTEKFNLIEEDVFWLSENPDADRSQQKRAWDASHVRSCHWVLLEDKTDGQKIAAYSTHLDVSGAIAREMGGKLIAERMTLLKEEYPDAIFFVGGDFNERPGNPGYNYIDEALNGMVDDGRYMAEERLNNEITCGGIDNLNLTGAHDASIDFIFADSAMAEVETFWVMTDNYNDLRPSDHQGVFITARALENNYVGGIAGSNNGTISTVIAEGTFEGGTAEGSGAILGANDYNAAVSELYAKDTARDTLIGEAFAVNALPASPSQEVVDALNAAGGVFELLDGQYRIIPGCGEKELTCVTVNGVDRYLFVGSVYTIDFEIPEGSVVYLDGEPFSGRSFIVPAEGAKISVATPAADVTAKVSAGDFTVSSLEEWMYVYDHLSWFASNRVTIHLLCDIDLSDPLAEGFAGFVNPAFSFDGHGAVISNWGSEDAPGGAGLFYITVGAGGMAFIRNLTLKNCHAKGSPAAVLYSVACGNAGLAGLPTSFSISNVTLDECSMVTTGQSSGLLLSRYGVSEESFTVDINNCRALNSFVDANSWEHVGILVGKVRRAHSGLGTFNISDCFLAGNEVVNTINGSGFVCGNIEDKTIVNIRNVGVFNNIGSGKEFSYLCANNGSGTTINADGILVGGNVVTADEVYLCGSLTANSPATVANLYSDAELTALLDGGTAEYTPNSESLASGEAGYLLNALAESPAFYWAKDDKTFCRPASEEEQLRKVTLRRDGGETVFYENGGDTLELGAPTAGSYFVAEGNSVLAENKLTVADDTVVAQVVRTSEVTEAVSSGDYTVEDVADWMALYENLAFFQNQNVTIRLTGDIDLSDPAAAAFTGFVNPAFSLDGHGHTVSRWGSADAPVTQRAMFYVTDGTYGMRSLKNLNLYDCHLSTDGNAAVLYSPAQNNGGLAGLPTEFTLENIHIDSSSVVTTGESAALLISRYGVSGAAFTVNILNCSVKNSSLDAGNMAHKGLLIGKPRQTDKVGTFNIEDCYLYNNTITNAINGAGFIFGTAEGGATVMNVENVGVVANTLSGTNDGAYAGYFDGYSTGSGSTTLSNVLFQDNALNTETAYLVAHNVSTMGVVTLSNVFSDIEVLTAPAEGRTDIVHEPDGAKIARGEAAYTVNQAIGDAPIYWGMEEEKLFCTDSDHQAAKLTLTLEDGTLLDTCYVSGGARVDLTLQKDPDATFETFGKAELEGNLLTMPKGMDLTVLVVCENPDVFLPDYRASVTTVTRPVYKGTYTVANVEEWMYLYEHAALFASADVTIALAGDIDLSAERAATFAGFKEARFSLDGGGYTVRNWTALESDTEIYNGLFSKYYGDSIRNLTIEGFKVGGGYSRAILISEYSSTSALTIENVHVKDSVLDATASGNQMAVFLSRTVNTAVNNAAITLQNCSVTDTKLLNSSGARINNSGLLIGSAYRSFRYDIANVWIQGCAVETDTGAGGFVIGAVEESGTEVTMDRVAIFDCTARVAATNELPGVFVGEMYGTPAVTVKNCMAADLTAEGRETLAFLRHSSDAVGITVSDCFADFDPVEALTSNNSEGIVAEDRGTLAGASALPSAAFKSGEAAWTANAQVGAALWLVDDSFSQYPFFAEKEGYAAPFKVTFGEAALYTNANGLLSPDGLKLLMENEDGYWLLGEELVTAATVFTADAALTYRPSTPGDADRSGDISIGDAVLVLRVISGSLSFGEINAKAANLYTADGITQNGGITTADVIEVMKLVLQ